MSLKRRAIRGVVKQGMKDPVKNLRRAQRLWRLYKKLPGFDAAHNSMWHYKGDRHAADENEPGPVGPKGMLLFAPVNWAITKALNKLPPFRKPKKTFERKKGPNEKPLNLD